MTRYGPPTLRTSAQTNLVILTYENRENGEWCAALHQPRKRSGEYKTVRTSTGTTERDALATIADLTMIERWFEVQS